MQSPIKILLYAPSPAITSGLSTFARNLLNILHTDPRFKVQVYGIKDRGNHKDPDQHPYPIYAFADAPDPDIYHRNHFLQVIQGAEPSLAPPWDIIIIIQHPSILNQPTDANRDGVMAFLRSFQKDTYTQKPPNHWFKTIGIFPLDSPSELGWVQDVIAITDTPILLSQYAKTAALRHIPGLDSALHLITPPIDTTVFHPLKGDQIQSFRSSYFRGQVDPDTFLISAIVKNYHLNDLPRILQIFKSFKTDHPNSYLYLHTSPTGPFVDILHIASQLGLEPIQDWAYPGHLTPLHQDSPHTINQILNATDCLLSATQGTWWGMNFMEAMATKTLVAAPAITSIPELLNTPPADQLPHSPDPSSYRGLPLKSGTQDSLWTSWGAGDHNLLRPLTDINHAKNQLLWAVNHPKAVKTITQNAYRWVKKHAVSRAQKTWIDQIYHTYHLLQAERDDAFGTLEKIIG